MPKYIELEKAIDLFYPVDPENDGADGTTVVLKSDTYTSAEIESMLSDLPAADVAPVVHAKRVKTKKHNWKKDIDGEIDLSAWEVGYCNGPFCLECGKSFCIHCEEKFRGEDAVEAKLNEETCCERTVCSVCGRPISEDAQYCNCGAKMDLEDDKQ